MLNKEILNGRLAHGHLPAHLAKSGGPRNATLSRKELQKIVRDMLG